QARAVGERAKSAPVTDRDAAIQSFIVGLDSLEAKAGSPPIAGIDIMHFTPRLTTDVSGLLSAIEGSSAPVTSGEREQLARLRQRYSAFRATAERVLGGDMERVNALLKETNVTPLLAKPKTP